VVHAYNPSNLGGWDWEDYGSKPVYANSLWDTPISKITQQNGLGCGSSGKMPALQAQSPMFKPQSHQKEKKALINYKQIEFSNI
jgi:hypothetical protein